MSVATDVAAVMAELVDTNCPLAWSALADLMEEDGSPLRAELIRLQQALLLRACDRPYYFNHCAPLQERITDLIGSGVSPVTPTMFVPIADGVGMDMVWIPPGQFIMGSPHRESPSNNDELEHPVSISRGFWMASTALTNDQYWTITTRIGQGTGWGHYPMQGMSWDESQALSLSLRAITKLPFRLPTEAEWEYACRAGTRTEYYTGAGVTQLLKAGWCCHGSTWGSGQRSKPVAQFQPNAWGLFDMHGNLWEWCQDYYYDWFYHQPPDDGSHWVEDPLNYHDDTTANRRVLRGGSWHDLAHYCRSAFRFHCNPDNQHPHYGCRFVVSG